jgi:hypothetical protein
LTAFAFIGCPIAAFIWRSIDFWRILFIVFVYTSRNRIGSPLDTG